MKTKKILVLSLILSAIMLLNISIIKNTDSNLSLSIFSLQKVLADGEGGERVDCWGKVTKVLGPCSWCTDKVNCNGCVTDTGYNWENPSTCVP